MEFISTQEVILIAFRGHSLVANCDLIINGAASIHINCRLATQHITNDGSDHTKRMYINLRESNTGTETDRN
jgi:hypothetical protein